MFNVWTYNCARCCWHGDFVADIAEGVAGGDRLRGHLCALGGAEYARRREGLAGGEAERVQTSRFHALVDHHVHVLVRVHALTLEP